MQRSNTNNSMSQIKVNQRHANVISSQTNSEKSSVPPATNIPVFRAEISNAQIIVFTLKGINTGKKDQHVLCEISDEIGIKFIATDASLAAQGSAVIKERLFDVWQVRTEETICFRISLAVLLQCLGCLGSTNLQHTDLKMAYFEREECFSLQLTEGSVLTECKIKTMIEHMDSDIENNDDSGSEDENAHLGSKVDFSAAFSNSPVVNKAIVKSELLRDAFAELAELPGAATVSVLMSPDTPFFRLSTHGQTASCEIDFPKGDESFTQFTCQKTMKCNYRSGLIQQAGKALSNADKTFIRMNEDGTLSIQHLILHPDAQKTHVDYYILAESPQDDSSSNDEESVAGENESMGNSE